MTLRTNPIERFRAFDQMDQMLESLFPPPAGDAPRFWAPLVDIKETEKSYQFVVDLAGVREEDLTVDLDNDVLTISGKRKKVTEDKHENYLRVERSYGSFMRKFTLDGPVDKSQVQADFKDGVLCVEVPKTKLREPVRIPVRRS